MCSLGAVVLRVRRAETPGYRVAKQIARWILTANLPIPKWLKPIGRLLYHIRFGLPSAWNRLKCLLWFHPLFACRCEAVGKQLALEALPDVHGQTLIYVGDNVRFSGTLTIRSGKFCDRPVLRIGDRSFLGHNVSITCNREVIVEDDVLIAGECKIADYDGHSAKMERRLEDSPPAMDEIRPVRICRGAWIGFGSMIMKGVTVGEGAVIGAHSIVTHNVPPFCMAAGSPARVVKQNTAVRKPMAVMGDSEAAVPAASSA